MVIRLFMMLALLCGTARAESLRLIVPEIEPVVGEMIPVTLRGEYSRPVALESLTFPRSDDYEWIQLARDQWRDERIDGRPLRVFERRLGVFPRRAGPLTIGPVIHQLTVVDEGNRREAINVEAPAVTLPVAPFPADGEALTARSLTIEDELSAAPGALIDGQTLVRRVTLRADGAMPHMLPARPVMREPWLISFASPERRDVEPTPEGPITTLVWEWSLRPMTGEPGVLPAVTIPWFDTRARQMRTAEIPAIPFGYASFHDNRTGADRLPERQSTLALAVFAGGLVVGLLLAVTGLSRRSRAETLRALRRLSPADPTRFALRRAARSDDLFRIRAAAARYIERRHQLDLPVTGEETAKLDALIYGRTGTVSSADRAEAVRAIFRRN